MSGIAIKLGTANFEDKNFGTATIEEVAIDKYLQYIEGDGQAYIQTKKEHNCYRLHTSDIASHIPEDAPRIEVECSCPYIGSDLATKAVLGTNGNHNVKVFAGSNDYITFSGNGAKVNNLQVEKDFKQKAKLTYGSVKSYVDNIKVADNTNMTNPYRLNPYPDDIIQLFYCNISSQDYYTKVRIYSYKVYHGDTLVLDLKPFKKADGTVCMKDDLTNEYYHNAGSGNFIAGPDL